MKWISSTKPAEATNKKLAKDLSTTFDYKQFESVAEAVSDAGDDSKLLRWINQKVKAATKQSVTNALTNNDGSKGEAGAVTDAIAVGKAWSIANSRERGTGVSARAEYFDTLLAKKRAGEEISAEDWEAALSQFGS